MIKVEDNACINVWVYGEDWKPKAYELLWSAMIVLAVVLMAGLYSRIVYTLWFKRDLDNEVTFQQRVSIKIAVSVRVFFFFFFFWRVPSTFSVRRPPDSVVIAFNGFASIFIHRAS